VRLSLQKATFCTEIDKTRTLHNILDSSRWKRAKNRKSLLHIFRGACKLSSKEIFHQTKNKIWHMRMRCSYKTNQAQVSRRLEIDQVTIACCCFHSPIMQLIIVHSGATEWKILHNLSIDANGRKLPNQINTFISANSVCASSGNNLSLKATLKIQCISRLFASYFGIQEIFCNVAVCQLKQFIDF